LKDATDPLRSIELLEAALLHNPIEVLGVLQVVEVGAASFSLHKLFLALSPQADEERADIALRDEGT
jgi:hypothetical protein